MKIIKKKSIIIFQTRNRVIKNLRFFLWYLKLTNKMKGKRKNSAKITFIPKANDLLAGTEGGTEKSDILFPFRKKSHVHSLSKYLPAKKMFCLRQESHPCPTPSIFSYLVPHSILQWLLRSFPAACIIMLWNRNIPTRFLHIQSSELIFLIYARRYLFCI